MSPRRRTGGCARPAALSPNAQARPQPKPVARTVATVSAPALPAAPAAKPVKAGKTPSADEGDWEQFWSRHTRPVQGLGECSSSAANLPLIN
jgi:hypothetical protein